MMISQRGRKSSTRASKVSRCSLAARNCADRQRRIGEMFHTLSKLISFRTIADEENREECRQGALYLKRVLRTLGAETALVSARGTERSLKLTLLGAPSYPAHLLAIL